MPSYPFPFFASLAVVYLILSTRIYLLISHFLFPISPISPFFYFHLSLRNIYAARWVRVKTLPKEIPKWVLWICGTLVDRRQSAHLLYLPISPSLSPFVSPLSLFGCFGNHPSTQFSALTLRWVFGDLHFPKEMATVTEQPPPEHPSPLPSLPLYPTPSFPSLASFVGHAWRLRR